MTPCVRRYAAEIAAEHQIGVDALLAARRRGKPSAALKALYRRLSADGYSSGQIGMWTGRDGSTVRAALTNKRRA